MQVGDDGKALCVDGSEAKGWSPDVKLQHDKQGKVSKVLSLHSSHSVSA